MLGGAWVVSDNQITHTGFPAAQPPRTSGLGPGHGIVAVQLHDISIRGNIVSHGRGDAITAMTALHYIIADNIVSADVEQPFGDASTGIVVAAADDVSVTGNSIRGFGHGITATDTGDRLRITGNGIEAAIGGTGVGIHVGAAVARVVVSGNTISGTATAATCLAVDGRPSASRVSRDNLCW